MPAAKKYSAPAVAVPELAGWVHDVRERTFELVADLNDEQLMGPRLEIVNPLLWEIGHTAWFEEKWVLRHTCGAQPIRSDGDSLYDSSAVPHDTRWDLALPSREETLRYMLQVREQLLEKLSAPQPSEPLLYFMTYCVFHGDMHNEAFTYTRQTLGYPPPKMRGTGDILDGGVRIPKSSDAEIPGGEFLLGAAPQDGFVFDNEKWAHLVRVAPFRMARAAVTQAEFCEFVEDGGYERRELWCEEGWRWRQRAGARQPLYWQCQAPGHWLRRHFDRWVPLEPNRAVLHVNWYEADAYCRWARRRLPSEAEWEAAAACLPEGAQLSARKRRFPWGNAAPSPEQANLDWAGGGAAGTACFAAGDSVYGCRQMIGNVWEWTSTPFQPYRGFVPDAYQDYSQPWFETHKVLRGGCWATRSRFIRNTYRNFYRPERRDVWAGFRTCA